MKIACSLLFAFMLVALMPKQADKANFSGTWHLVPAECEFGIIPEESVPVKFVIQQGKEAIRIQRLSAEKDTSGKIREYTENLPFNGNTSTIVRWYDNVIKNTSFEWKGEREFRIDAGYKLPTDTAKYVMFNVEFWTLSEDGNKCTIKSHIENSSGTGEEKWVLEKKE